MYKLQACDLDNVTGGGKFSTAVKGASAAYKGIKKAYEFTKTGVEVAGVMAAAGDLAYRGYNLVRGKHD